MCGINFIAAAAQADLRPVLHQMMQKTAFRGPDAEGEFYHSLGSQTIALGANRLRIVDNHEFSDQPMQSDCGNYVLAYNGEVYNYPDLKSELLRQGQDFRTASDTEVVLYWLKHEGPDGLGQLKGMFALVFIDLVKESIIIARDRHGIKPLFYSFKSGNLLVSSALSAIASNDLLKKRLNRRAVQEYLTFRHVLGTQTFYEDVQAVEPGSYLVYHGSDISRGSIAMPTDNNKPLDLKEALIDAVTLSTSTNETAGLFLSGGVDSTLILALYRHELGFSGMPSFTLNTGIDAKWAEKAAKQFNAEHTQVNIELRDLEAAFEFLNQLDQPIADHGALATWLIAEKAGLKHRVLLTGAGADELFAGYNRHRAFNSYLRNKNKWLNYKKLAEFIGYFGHPEQLKTFLYEISDDKSQTFYNFLAIHGVDHKYQKSKNNSHNNYSVKDMPGALEFDRRNYLVNDVLAITDLASMSHGIEARVPYLYDDVVRVAGKLTVGERVKQKGKAPLKDILNSYGGQAFTKRQKLGFGLPMAEYMRKEQFPFWSVLHNDDPVFELVSREAITHMKEAHRQGKKDWNMQLWSILVLSNWLKLNFN
jgi:asparagine synthase (glutamine-hydrolysing)